MKHALIALAVGATLLLPVIGNARPDLATASVQGIVVDSDRHLPVAGVLVYLAAAAKPDERSVVNSTFTDKAGSYAFKALRGGQYWLRFQRNGYDILVLENLKVDQNEAVILSSPLVLHKSAITIIDYPTHRSPCGSLVQPGQTADVYIVCGDRL